MRPQISILAKMFLLGFIASAVQGAETPRIFHSAANDGIETPPPPIPTDGAQMTLNLFIRSGPASGSPEESASGTACTGSGLGDEVCQWRTTVNGLGGVQLVSFIPAVSVRFVLDGNELRAIGGNPISPNVSPSPVGILTVTANAAGTVAVDGDFVSSEFTIEGIAEVTLASTSSP
jgi:hypothetical protein